ncbi:MAG: tyrosine-type recombinase/integrase [Acidimicrobiia bacterium]
MADRFAREVEVDKYHGTSVDHQLGKATVADYTARWEATRADLARSTRDRDHGYLKKYVKPVFGDLSVTQVRTSEVELWLAQNLAELAPATRAKCLQLLRSVLDLARRDRAIAANPAADVKPPTPTPVRKTRVLTDEQATALIDAAEVVDERIAGIVWVMLRAGLRFGEAAALKRSDIDLAAGTLSVQRSLTRADGVQLPKTAAAVRTIPMTADLTARITEHITAMPPHIDGWLFTQPKGGAVDYNRWRNRIWLPITELADLKGVNAHDLRHTCLTRLARVDGWPPSALQAIAGHSDPRTTLAVYVHVTADQLPTPSTMEALM